MNVVIRFNLDHLLKRYRKELDAVLSNLQQDVLLNLDPHETNDDRQRPTALPAGSKVTATQ